MDEGRRQLWIAMSELWLDNELDESRLEWIASAVRASGLDRPELEVVFRDELAPFLGSNQSNVAGVWDGFDPDWVCAEAQKRRGQRSFIDRLCSRWGLTTHAARPAWERVLEIAFGD